MRLPALFLPFLLLALTLDFGCMQRERTDVDVDTDESASGGGDDGGKDVPGAAGGSASDGGSSASATPAGGGQDRNFSGSLAAGDATLQSGEYMDAYTIDVRSGQTVTVDMMSSELDPYLILKAPSGSQVDNDDYNGDRTRSRIEHVASESGPYSVLATSYQPGETGSYTVAVHVGQGTVGGDAGAPPPPSGGK